MISGGMRKTKSRPQVLICAKGSNETTRSPRMAETSHAQPVPGRVDERFDNPLERLRLLAGDDDAIASFLDEFDVKSPREREMLAELARPGPLAHPNGFEADHRRLIEALESLRRHGFHGSRSGSSLGPLGPVVRWLVQLVARYLVVSYIKSVATQMRNLYWVRELESESDSRDLKLLRPARFDANALVEIMRSREIGVPSFVLAGLLLPLGATILAADERVPLRQLGRCAARRRNHHRGRSRALLDRAARLRARERPDPALRPGGRSLSSGRTSAGAAARRATAWGHGAIVAIVLMVAVWIVLPGLVALALAT